MAVREGLKDAVKRSAPGIFFAGRKVKRFCASLVTAGTAARV
jgi:hypothetical protein